MMRNGKKVKCGSATLVLDTRSDNEWFVLRRETGDPVARQAKRTAGRRFRQGTNPDYDGYDTYPLDTFDAQRDEWIAYSSDARKGQLLGGEFLSRLASMLGLE